MQHEKQNQLLISLEENSTWEEGGSLKECVPDAEKQQLEVLQPAPVLQSLGIGRENRPSLECKSFRYRPGLASRELFSSTTHSRNERKFHTQSECNYCNYLALRKHHFKVHVSVKHNNSDRYSCNEHNFFCSPCSLTCSLCCCYLLADLGTQVCIMSLLYILYQTH